jgi:amino acid permease
LSALLQGSSSSSSSSSIGNNININNINKWYTSRTSIILILSTFVLLPLNLIKDLNSLGFTSILGLLSVLYTVGFMFIRAFDGSYSVGSNGGGSGSGSGGGIGGGGKVASTASAIVGKFIMDGSLTANQIPTFTKSTLWNIDINSLVLTSNLGLAFIAHYNAPSYWKSLKGNNATSKTFTTISNYSYIILSIIYVVTMICGYITFGDISMGNILLNYSSNDILALFGRIATGLSIIFGFPLISNGCREGFKNMCISLNIMNGKSSNGKSNSNNGNGTSSNNGIDITNPNNHTTLVLCLLITTTFLSIIAKDIGLIAGLTGALMGSSLVYICPPLIYYKIIQRKYNDNENNDDNDDGSGSGSVISSTEYKNAKKNLLFIPFGIFTATMGIIMTLKNAFF